MQTYRVRFTKRETSFVETYIEVQAESPLAAYDRVEAIQAGEIDATPEEEESEYCGKEYVDSSEFEGMDNPKDWGVVSLVDARGVFQSCHAEFADWPRPTAEPSPPTVEADKVTISAADLRALVDAASAWADDLESGLEDGTYDDEGALPEVRAALERVGLADLIEAAGDDTCTACGRASLDCSIDPCPAVIADREA